MAKVRPADPALTFQRMLRLLIGPRSGAAPRGDLRKVVELCRTLLTEQGEFSGRRIATDALLAYAMLDLEGREKFFDRLVEDFSPSPEALSRAADAYRDEPTQKNLIRLQTAVEPPRQELFRRLNQGEGGTAVLVELRRHLLTTLRSIPSGPASMPISRICSARGSIVAFFIYNASIGAPPR